MDSSTRKAVPVVRLEHCCCFHNLSREKFPNTFPAVDPGHTMGGTEDINPTPIGSSFYI